MKRSLSISAVLLLAPLTLCAGSPDRPDLELRVEQLERRMQEIERALARQSPTAAQDILADKDGLWGASPREIDAITVAAQRRGDALVVTGTVAGLNAHTGYRFVAERLAEIRTAFLSGDAFRVENRNTYIEEYRRLHAMLGEKYGEPDVDQEIWENELLRGDADRLGQALAVGHVRWAAAWRSEKTFIALVLYGAENRLFLELSFMPTESVGADLDEVWAKWMSDL